MHLGVVGLGKKVLSDVPGMTPARFDLMFAIKAGKFRWQRDIQKALGLHPSTVSKLITRLERLGWLVRVRPKLVDQRQRIVQLTEEGDAAIKLAMRIAMKRQFFRQWYRPLFLPYSGLHRCAERRTLDRMTHFYELCGSIASCLGRERTGLVWPPPYQD